MRENTHTPGPWSCDPNDLMNGDEIAVRSDVYPDAVVAVVWPWGDDEAGTGEREANARLIAAAPDLLAACEALRLELFHCADQLARKGHRVPDGGSVRRALMAGVAALAKARSEGCPNDVPR